MNLSWPFSNNIWKLACITCVFNFLYLITLRFFSYSNCPCCADAVSMMAKVPKKLAGIAIGVLEREWSPNCMDMAHHT